METGRAKAVGVCNFNREQLEEMQTALSKHNISLACNQVRVCVFGLLVCECQATLTSCR